MQTHDLIGVDKFCANHNIEISFISSLQQNGLIEIQTIRESGFIEPGQLHQLEKMVRLYYELDINLEGIETINYLLEKLNRMQDENIAIRNRLRLYESED
jgi:hypothetical protein